MDEPILHFDSYNSPRPHSLSPLPKVSLEIMRGRVQQRIRHVQTPVFLIGAASDCDLVLGDLQFPEAYAYLFVNGSQVTIRRLGTGPQLLVCGQPSESAELFHGDLVAFGPFELRLQIHEPPVTRRDPSEPAIYAFQDASPPADAVDEVRVLLADIYRELANDPPRREPIHPFSNRPWVASDRRVTA